MITRVERVWMLGNFKKELQKREREVVLLEKLQNCVDLLFQDPRSPGLNTEKLRHVGTYAVFSARLSVASRLIFVQLARTEIGLLHFDSDHDGAYRWLDQNGDRIATMLNKDEQVVHGTPIRGFRQNRYPAHGRLRAPVACAAEVRGGRWS